VLNKRGKFGVKIFFHYKDIVIFVLGHFVIFVLIHPVDQASDTADAYAKPCVRTKRGVCGFQTYCSVFLIRCPVEMKLVYPNFTSKLNYFVERINVTAFSSPRRFRFPANGALEMTDCNVSYCTRVTMFCKHGLTAALSLAVPPRWKVEPQDSSVVLGHSVIVDCQSDADPEPVVTWKKGEHT